MSHIVEVADTQLGYREGPRNTNKYGAAYGMNGVSWCAEFTWWVIRQATGVDVRHLVTPGWALCSTGLEEGRRKGFGTSHPVPGDVVFYHWPGEHPGPNHTGIFVADAGSSIVADEGNTGGGSETNGEGVYRRTRSKSLVVGYLHVVNEPAGSPKPAPVPASPTVATELQTVEFEIGLSKRLTLVEGDGAHNGRHDAVYWMQHGINAAHVRWLGSPVVSAESGEFDHHTAGALQLFQGSRGLVPDGICGPASWSRLYP